MSVHIELKLFAHLSKYLPSEGERLSIEPGQSVAEVLDTIGLPAEKAKLIFINGIKGTLDTVLHGGERVGLFPPVAGG
ncbi:MAG: MoaD/ThiS family protein [Desulfosarcinaceae bacterium]|nr:MoaD/ThiS family protein [Desulfosarcinaceae bacterium]